MFHCLDETIASPCHACFTQSFRDSVWMAYEPMFTFLLGALYGPLPLLVVLKNIYTGMRGSRTSNVNVALQPANELGRLSPRESTRFMSSTLLEYYSNDGPAADSCVGVATSSSEADAPPPAVAAK